MLLLQHAATPLFLFFFSSASGGGVDDQAPPELYDGERRCVNNMRRKKVEGMRHGRLLCACIYVAEVSFGADPALPTVLGLRSQACGCSLGNLPTYLFPILRWLFRMWPESIRVRANNIEANVDQHIRHIGWECVTE